MSLYRCAACGSPNVVTDTESDGVSFNYKKAIAGTVVLGVGGAVAGIESNRTQVFKCPDCGAALSYPMDADMKAVIDSGVRDPDLRDRLRYKDIPLSWDFLRKRYQHIESGAGDQILQTLAEGEKKLADMRSSANRDIAEALMKFQAELDTENALASQIRSNTDELQAAWERETEQLAQQKQSFAKASGWLSKPPSNGKPRRCRRPRRKEPRLWSGRSRSYNPRKPN